MNGGDALATTLWSALALSGFSEPAKVLLEQDVLFTALQVTL
jgi:hypothetical protein